MASVDEIREAIQLLSGHDLAAEMLLEAHASPDCALLLNKLHGAPPLVEVPFGRSFGDPEDRRSRAPGYAAFQHLQQLGLVDDPSAGGALYPLTDLGSEVAATMKARNQGVQKQLNNALAKGKKP
jgi:hypothetical protein